MAGVLGQSAVQEAIAGKVDALVFDAETARRRLGRLLPAFRDIVADEGFDDEAFEPAGPTSLSIATLRVEGGDVAEVLELQDRLAELPGIHEIALHAWDDGTVTVMLAMRQLPSAGRRREAETSGLAD